MRNDTSTINVIIYTYKNNRYDFLCQDDVNINFEDFINICTIAENISEMKNILAINDLDIESGLYKISP